MLLHNWMYNEWTVLSPKQCSAVHLMWSLISLKAEKNIIQFAFLIWTSWGTSTMNIFLQFRTVYYNTTVGLYYSLAMQRNLLALKWSISRTFKFQCSQYTFTITQSFETQLWTECSIDIHIFNFDLFQWGLDFCLYSEHWQTEH